MSHKNLPLFDPVLLQPALADAFKKLDPRVQWRNPVMFVVYVGSAFTTALSFAKPDFFTIAVTVWLWFTVLFANFAESVAEGRGKAQADTLRRARTDTQARLLADDPNLDALLELHAMIGREQVIAQKFVPAVSKGDKRVLLVDGEPVGAINRVPADGQVRSNLRVGGRAEVWRAVDQSSIQIKKDCANAIKNGSHITPGDASQTGN